MPLLHAEVVVEQFLSPNLSHELAVQQRELLGYFVRVNVQQRDDGMANAQRIVANQAQRLCQADDDNEFPALEAMLDKLEPEPELEAVGGGGNGFSRSSVSWPAAPFSVAVVPENRLLLVIAVWFVEAVSNDDSEALPLVACVLVGKETTY